MTNFQHLAEPSESVASTLKSVHEHAGEHATDTLSMVTHSILDTLAMEEKTHVVDTNHQVSHLKATVHLSVLPAGFSTKIQNILKFVSFFL
jgi:hypothetical protein